MEIIIVLIGISLSIAVGFLFLFLWNLRSGQYDDTYSPAVRMLMGEPKKKATEKNPEKEPGAETP